MCAYCEGPRGRSEGKAVRRCRAALETCRHAGRACDVYTRPERLPQEDWQGLHGRYRGLGPAVTGWLVARSRRGRDRDISERNRVWRLSDELPSGSVHVRVCVLCWGVLVFFSYCVSILIVLIFVFPVVAFDLPFYVSGLPPHIYLSYISFPLLVRHGWSIHWKPESNQYLLDQRSIGRLVYCP